MTIVPSRMPVAVVGAGAIGRMHVERMLSHPDVCVAGVADPTPAAREFCEARSLPYFDDHRALLDQPGVKAAIVATPNATHADVGIDCIERGLTVLMEKPVADTAQEGRRLCEAAWQARVPLMVGHQRRHNPIIRRARQLLRQGAVGRAVSVTALATWLKPDSYFDAVWRRQAGAGPVLINLIHDIDLLRHLVGEVESVQAIASSAVRGFEVEDTAAVILRFANGALGTMAVSDAAVAPWNWDLAAGEADHYAQVDVDTHFISGTEGSLTLPRLNLWKHSGKRGWHEPLAVEREMLHRQDPYIEQLRHLRAVAEGREQPVCSGEDGLRTLLAALAIGRAAREGQPVTI
ncbi:1,5-anhydro-D-fructose reductase [Variovorax sp. PBS-H4]|uniref:Gfo/Idh/MocA family protein n=1 Tax=Variovorax sp. PBS-H4 TaxID=434008 RepID=UPI001317F59D|nr:Gfo/Idh/MocA family oxidoreductase [Variovorax sp. PBS-H4]VTU36449.1 1,5-anhydro-D-fructose reductase [Variovorax sp. PBS-H4]